MATYAKGMYAKKSPYGMNVSFQVDKFIEWLQSNKNEKGYVNVNINELKEPDQYKNTHSITLYEPKK